MHPLTRSRLSGLKSNGVKTSGPAFRCNVAAICGASGSSTMLARPLQAIQRDLSVVSPPLWLGIGGATEMTADDQPELIDATAQAIAQGMEQATTYWQAAAAAPGYGMEVRLPSAPGTVGLSYDQAPEAAPAPGRPSLKLTPDYASPAVGGDPHLAGSPAARTQWPSGTTVTVLGGTRPSSVTYAPASEPWTKRLAAAIKLIKLIFGRS
jgi:hypothetical protein